MKKQSLLKKLYDYFEQQEFCVELDSSFLYVHHSMVTIYLDKKVFNLSFEVNCDPTTASIVSQALFAFSEIYKCDIDVYEPYAFVLNDEGDKIEKVLFGEQADFYHNTGEIPVKEKKESKIDPQKEVDTILDQINIKGMKSLKKNQKQFLVNFSKGKFKNK